MVAFYGHTTALTPCMPPNGSGLIMGGKRGPGLGGGGKGSGRSGKGKLRDEDGLELK